MKWIIIAITITTSGQASVAKVGSELFENIDKCLDALPAAARNGDVLVGYRCVTSDEFRKFQTELDSIGHK